MKCAEPLAAVARAAKGPCATQIRLSSSAPARPEIREEKWKQDTVYLYQFPKPPVVPNFSPFAVKVETYMRANKINYETRESYRARSKYGLIPFVELNGQHIADSQIILDKLGEHFKIENPLSGSDRGTARALEMMLDKNTHFALVADRSKRAEQMMSRPISGMPLPRFITDVIAGQMKNMMSKRARNALGRLSDDEMRGVIRKDLTAVADILGEKRFLFGNKVTRADCTVFGHLGVMYYLPFRQYGSDILDDELPLLRDYVARMRQHFYPDWKHNDL